jgi:hypothetical protein
LCVSPGGGAIQRSRELIELDLVRVKLRRVNA